MSNVLAIRDNDIGSRVLVPYSEMTAEQRTMLKQVCSSVQLNDAQFSLLVEVARRSGLDPFRKHLYGLIFDGKFTLFTGIDGFRAVARRNGLCGIAAPIHTYMDEKDPEHTTPLTSTITVYRRGPTGEREEYTATAHMREYRRFKRDGALMPNWRQMPHIMLDKCAEALAHRKAFTESLGGIYERVEFGEADGDALAKTANAPRKLADILQQPVKATRPAGSEPIDADFSERNDDEHDPTDSEAP